MGVVPPNEYDHNPIHDYCGLTIMSHAQTYANGHKISYLVLHAEPLVYRTTDGSE